MTLAPLLARRLGIGDRGGRGENIRITKPEDALGVDCTSAFRLGPAVRAVQPRLSWECDYPSFHGHSTYPHMVPYLSCLLKERCCAYISFMLGKHDEWAVYTHPEFGMHQRAIFR